MKNVKIIVSVTAIGIAAYALWPTKAPDTMALGTALAEVTLPATLSDNAQIGKTAYDANCASCHGPNGAGTDGKAPPLIHKIYEPNHHATKLFNAPQPSACSPTTGPSAICPPSRA